MWVGHSSELLKLTYQMLALRQCERRRADARDVSFRNSVRFPIYLLNTVNKAKLSSHTFTEAQFL